MGVREPIVAGQFYPASRNALEAQIRQYLETDLPKEEAIGVILPHAGYVYSGPVAGAVLSSVRIRATCVILGPSHTGRGKPFSIMTEGSWKTPLGEVEIDGAVGKGILDSSQYLEEDVVAHLFEHSIEVEVPLLQYLRHDIRMVPIILAQAPASTYKEIGRGIATAIKDTGAEVLIAASTDMTHYEPHELARQKDMQAIQAILELDADELVQLIRELRLTMCGYAPVITLISAAKELGAVRTKLVRYQTSGDVTGDYSSVVGYAGIVIGPQQ